MCGIAGFANLKGNNTTKEINLMCDLIRHRGPDDEGYIIIDRDENLKHLYGKDTVQNAKHNKINISKNNFEAKIGFGHRRLAILDISEDGHQPMLMDNNIIVHNGEGYNYIEGRSQIE